MTRPLITPDNYPATLAQLWALASLAVMEHADTLGAILDPTLYRDKSTALHEDLAMLRTLRHVQTTLAGMRGRRAGA